MFAFAGIAHRIGGPRRRHYLFARIERRARDLASKSAACVTSQTLLIVCSSLLPLQRAK